MSTKSTIFLTNDNEHCYSDCGEPVYKEGKYIGDKITIEIDPKNYNLISNDDEGIIIELINPESEIYQLIKLMKGKAQLPNL